MNEIIQIIVPSGILKETEKIALEIVNDYN